MEMMPTKSTLVAGRHQHLLGARSQRAQLWEPPPWSHHHRVVLLTPQPPHLGFLPCILLWRHLFLQWGALR